MLFKCPEYEKLKTSEKWSIQILGWTPLTLSILGDARRVTTYPSVTIFLLVLATTLFSGVLYLSHKKTLNHTWRHYMFLTILSLYCLTTLLSQAPSVALPASLPLLVTILLTGFLYYKTIDSKNYTLSILSAFSEACIYILLQKYFLNILENLFYYEDLIRTGKKILGNQEFRIPKPIPPKFTNPDALVFLSFITFKLLYHNISKKRLAITTYITIIALTIQLYTNGLMSCFFGSLFLIFSSSLQYILNKHLNRSYLFSLLKSSLAIIAALSFAFIFYIYKDHSSITVRLRMWESALNIFKEFPIFGTGSGMSNFHYSTYGNHCGQMLLNWNLHSSPIQVLVDQGLLFFALLTLFLTLSLHSLYQFQKQENNSSLILLVLLSISPMLIMGVQYQNYFIPFFLALYLALFSSIPGSKKNTKRKNTTPHLKIFYIYTLISISAFASVLYSHSKVIYSHIQKKQLVNKMNKAPRDTALKAITLSKENPHDLALHSILGTRISNIAQETEYPTLREELLNQSNQLLHRTLNHLPHQYYPHYLLGINAYHEAQYKKAFLHFYKAKHLANAHHQFSLTLAMAAEKTNQLEFMQTQLAAEILINPYFAHSDYWKNQTLSQKDITWRFLLNQAKQYNSISPSGTPVPLSSNRSRKIDTVLCLVFIDWFGPHRDLPSYLEPIEESINTKIKHSLEEKTPLLSNSFWFLLKGITTKNNLKAQSYFDFITETKRFTVSKSATLTAKRALPPEYATIRALLSLSDHHLTSSKVPPSEPFMEHASLVWNLQHSHTLGIVTYQVPYHKFLLLRALTSRAPQIKCGFDLDSNFYSP